MIISFGWTITDGVLRHATDNLDCFGSKDCDISSDCDEDAIFRSSSDNQFPLFNINLVKSKLLS